MTDQEFEKLLLENKENLREMFEFWTWVRGLNKGLKWLALTGIPISIGIWGALKWFKNR